MIQLLEVVLSNFRLQMASSNDIYKEIRRDLSFSFIYSFALSKLFMLILQI